MLISILAIGLIITIHEAGHFLFARLFGAGVVEFTIGMGPRIASVIRGETRYSLRILPFGGACIMLGEDSGDENEDSEGERGEAESRQAEDGMQSGIPEGYKEADGRLFPKSKMLSKLPAWKRFFIVIGGPLFNFLLAMGLSCFIVGAAGFDRPLVVQTEEGLPAAESGIEAGDLLVSAAIGGEKADLRLSRDFTLFLYMHQQELQEQQPVSVTVLKADGSWQSYSLTPRYSEKTGSNRLGITYNAAYEKPENPGEYLYFSFQNARYSISTSFKSLGMMLKGRVSGNDITGPVGMVAVLDESVSQAADYGFLSAVLTLFDLMMIISASLGVMNLLPIPALDGGRLVFIFIEMLTGHPVPRKAEGLIHAAGFLVLLILMALIMFNDIRRLIFGG